MSDAQTKDGVGIPQDRDHGLRKIAAVGLEAATLAAAAALTSDRSAAKSVTEDDDAGKETKRT